MAKTAFGGERRCCSPLLSHILLILIAIAWVAPAMAGPVQIDQIRHWSGAEHTRVVLDLSAKPVFRDRRTADPPVVTVEIDDAVLAAGVTSQAIGDGRLAEVAVESAAGSPARVSFRLNGKRAVKVFMLGPAQGKPHRLVVDILGAPLPATASATAPPAQPAANVQPSAPAGSAPATETAPAVVSGPTRPAGPEADAGAAAAPGTSPVVPAATSSPPVTEPKPTAPPTNPDVAAQVPDAVSRPGLPETAVPSPSGGPRRVEPKARSRPWIVVIDPGHGGEDPGARGPGGVLEKDLCLSLSRALAADLNRRPGIEAHLTRDKDFFIPLRRRTRIAAEKSADLFVSVHANASRDKKAHGTEVYFLSLRGASDAGAREVAMRENASDLVAGVPPTAQDEIEEILVDLMRTKVLERSSELASTVIDGLQADNRLVLRGVKQAGFDVLKTASMPSILIETAFISHSKEAKLMKTKSFQQRFGSLVGGAVADYLARAGAVDEVPVEAGDSDPPAAASARPAGD